MRQIEYEDILRYVHHIAMHPFEDVDELSKQYLNDKAPSLIPKQMIVSDLVDIPSSKRALVINIVRKKTNIDIGIMFEGEARLIKKQGEILEPVMKKDISVIEPIEKESDMTTENADGLLE